MSINQISVEQLKAKLDAKQDFFLLDVREEFEKEICSIGGVLIPLADLEDRKTEVPSGKEIVVHCRSGGRSSVACEQLLSWGYKNVANLSGGILAWADRIDKTIKKY